MHGFNAEGNRFILGERVAVLHTLQRFPPNLDQRHRLKQLAVAFVGPTLTKSFEQRRIDLDTCCLRHAKNLAEADTIRTHQPGHPRSRPIIAFVLEQAHLRGVLALG